MIRLFRRSTRTYKLCPVTRLRLVLIEIREVSAAFAPSGGLVTVDMAESSVVGGCRELTLYAGLIGVLDRSSSGQFFPAQD